MNSTISGETLPDQQQSTGTKAIDLAVGIFSQASELPSSKWPEFVKDACKGNQQLEQTILKLLLADSESHSVLDNLDHASATLLNPQPGIGQDLGGYELVEETGGLGNTVEYRVRTRGERNQFATAKIAFKLGIAEGDEELFRLKLQQAQKFNHPALPEILCTGETEDYFYFIQEQIKGEAIVDFCNQRKLGISDRLRLFVEVCNTVSDLHQAGVIPTIISPDNIMIVADEQRLIRFREFEITVNIESKDRWSDAVTFVAESDLLEATSPNSILNQRIRMSICSMGALLFELMTGLPCFKLGMETMSLTQARELKQIFALPSPTDQLSQSDRIEEIALNRSTSKMQLLNLLDSDLSKILVRSVHPTLELRYDAIEDLGHDVQIELQKFNEDLIALIYSEISRLNQSLGGQELTTPDRTLRLTRACHKRLYGEDIAEQNKDFYLAAADAVRKIHLEPFESRENSLETQPPRKSPSLPKTHSKFEITALGNSLNAFDKQWPLHSAAFKLNYFLGLSVTEISTTLGIKPALTKQHLLFSRAWLKRISEPSG